MAVQLEIQDGNPWWLSADIWTVPGSDPEGLAGTPIAGSTCFLWARVSNTGSSDVQNAVVRFYWANPSVGFDRNTANPIGYFQRESIGRRVERRALPYAVDP